MKKAKIRRRSGRPACTTRTRGDRWIDVERVLDATDDVSAPRELGE